MECVKSGVKSESEGVLKKDENSYLKNIWKNKPRK